MNMNSGKHLVTQCSFYQGEEEKNVYFLCIMYCIYVMIYISKFIFFFATLIKCVVIFSHYSIKVTVILTNCFTYEKAFLKILHFEAKLLRLMVPVYLICLPATISSIS